MDSENIALGELVSVLSARILDDYRYSDHYLFWLDGGGLRNQIKPLVEA